MTRKACSLQTGENRQLKSDLVGVPTSLTSGLVREGNNSMVAAAGISQSLPDSERMSRLAALLRLYVITDRELSLGRDDRDVVRQAIAGGATAVQLRGKRMGGLEMFRTAIALRDIAAQHDVMFIVNDRLDVALAVEADGVHLGQEDIPAREALELIERHDSRGRRTGGVWPGRMLLGISAANPAEAMAAERDGADYIGAGPVWATATKPDADAPIGPEGIRAICSSVRIPVVAIGGISRDNASLLVGAGVAGIAVISAVVAAADVREAARSLREAVDRLAAWSTSCAEGASFGGATR